MKRFVNQLPKEVLLQRRYPRQGDERGDYFRDTTAIIHSYPFRRLKHKTQVFFSPKNDHICTRIEHVMHVASVAAAICRGLDLDADLAWAIGLGHDLGHTPFGHVGEEIMNDLKRDFGGFIHELYSLRVVDHLVNYGRGMNLTYAVRDGIVNHCGEKFEQFIRPDFQEKDLGAIEARDRYPSTWEGTVVRVSDKIAYLGRDLEDAQQLKIIEKADIPEEVARI
ncbi:MAG TPA: HD domain-containing protein, partial [Sediminispirochaeta sp.]|nr:HD domain-containing protein [Sediminispirochaeta sp.]